MYVRMHMGTCMFVGGCTHVHACTNVWNIHICVWYTIHTRALIVKLYKYWIKKLFGLQNYYLLNSKYPLKCRKNIGQGNLFAFYHNKPNKKHNRAWDEHTDVQPSFAALLPTVLRAGYQLGSWFFMLKTLDMLCHRHNQRSHLWSLNVFSKYIYI
jgi:hypothetical protein